jgi:alpha-L-rhamnosidase
LQPVELRCEYLKNPLATDEPAPRLTWRDISPRSNQKQIAYQILVASDKAILAKNRGDLWDSGKTASDETANISYHGEPLHSRQRCFWKVRVWDGEGLPSTWSEIAFWRMGLMKGKDWNAEYITFRDATAVAKNPAELYLPAAHQFRKEFVINRPVSHATLYATALGVYEVRLNGKKAGDVWLAPGWTDYHQRAYYQAFDVSDQITTGTNALGAWLADGWYSGYLGFGLLTGIGTEHIGRYTYGKTPAFMGQLEIEYTDGAREIIGTDTSWKVSGKGPIREADLLMGESYDARREQKGWDEAGFDEKPWDQALAAEDAPRVKANFYQFENPPPGGGVAVKGYEVDLGFKRPPILKAHPGSPVHDTEHLKPIAKTSPTNGVYIFNFGQNFAGVVTLRVRGAAGTKVRLRYGEMLYPDGRLMTENLRKARATDYYVLRGDSDGEVYTPRFTFHGFQYVELTGFPGEPGMDAVTGIVLHSQTPLTSQFECSDPMAKKLFTNIVWTQRANFLDLPTDCPQRDERFGWTGDAQTYIRTATFNADVGAFYTKWIQDLMDSQRPSGTFPGYAPFPFQHGLDFGTAWCDAGVICPWTIYQAYGDKRILTRCWEPMVKFLKWRESESKDNLGVAHGNEWGDWLSVDEKTPIDYIDTAYFALSTKLMERMAEALGKYDEADHYAKLFDRIRAAYLKKYWIEDTGRLSVDTQTAYALGIYTGLVPEDKRRKAGGRLAEKIREKGVMTTGFLGTRVLLPALTSCGENDLAVQLFQSHKFPSWGYEVDQGATTIWERWNSYTKDQGFGGEQNASMNSFAHYAFGAVCEWMFTSLAGIDAAEPGYKQILIKPMPPKAETEGDRKPINWVRARYDSIRGPIEVSWKLNAGLFDLETSIPPNTSALVYLPTANKDTIQEGNKTFVERNGMSLVRTEGGRAVIQVGSGKYHFQSKP